MTDVNYRAILLQRMTEDISNTVDHTNNDPSNVDESSINVQDGDNILEDVCDITVDEGAGESTEKQVVEMSDNREKKEGDVQKIKDNKTLKNNDTKA